MDLERTAVEIADRKIVRRGLLAGAVALTIGALSKFTAKPAQAVDPQDIDMDTVNTSTALTTLQSAPSGAGYTVIKVENRRIADAIEAIGGPGSLGNSGRSGLVATGGNNSQGTIGGVASNGGHAIEATGGSTVSGFGVGGKGVQGFGGEGGSATGGVGVEGTGGFATNGGVGVRGFGGGASGSQGSGMVGSTNSASNAGVQGNNGGTGPGVRGLSTNGIGVVGASTNQAGVFGQSSGAPGVHGESIGSLGVRGLSTNFVGVVGVSTNNHGLYGSTSSPSAVGLVGENSAGGLAGIFTGRVEVHGSFQVFGVKNAVLRMPDGTNASVYCQESPEPYFEDFGRAQLVGGVARVPLEREFAVLVAGSDYMVFLTPGGDSRGLFVSQQTPAGFEVRESQGGTGSIPFTYRIVTKRKDVEGKRFARVSDDGIKSVAAARSALAKVPLPAASVPPVGTGPGNPLAPPFAPGPGQQLPNLPRTEQPGQRPSGDGQR